MRARYNRLEGEVRRASRAGGKAKLRSLLSFLLGAPLPTQRLAQERLNNVRALAAFSPDALSSIAYANQEIFLGLVAAGAAGLAYSLPIGLAIVGLLIAVALSYGQTLPAYPDGGGSYAVARDNLGQWLGLLAGACLLIDYVLTAAVSLTAGIAAIASAFPELWPHRTAAALICLLVIMLANLRGLREAGTVMAVPVYLFLVTYLGMLAIGLVKAALGEPSSFEHTAPPPTQALTTFLVLHALASGCTALTGIEAISNGVPVFRPPEAKNATRTLGVMALLMGALFLGSIGLTQYFAVVAGPNQTILAALVERVLGHNVLFYVVQAATFLVLTVAANTSFAGFPRLASILAQDGYAPRQLSFLGDRLVFANGILLLAALTALLIVLFSGDTHALIPLFAVGVFLAFTLSQAGMVIHWFRVRGSAWLLKAAINGLGALATAAALVVILISKFVDGAWIVVLLIPLMLAAFRTVKEHYREVGRELTLRGMTPDTQPLRPPQIILPISGVHRAVVEALRRARSISDRVTAVYVEVNPGDADRIRREWEVWGQGVPLVVLESPYRSVVAPFLEYLDTLDQDRSDGQLAWVLLPEFVPAHWWQHLLHNQTAWAIKLALLYRRRRYDRVRVIMDIPWHLRK